MYDYLKYLIPLGALATIILAYIAVKKYIAYLNKHKPKLYSHSIEYGYYNIYIEDYTENQDLRVIDIYFKEYFGFRYKRIENFDPDAFNNSVSSHKKRLVLVRFNKDIMNNTGTLKIKTSEGELFDYIHPVLFDTKSIRKNKIYRHYRYTKFIEKYNRQHKRLISGI